MKHAAKIRFELNKKDKRVRLGAVLKKLEKILSGEFKKSGIISVAFVSNKESRGLNRAYRKKDKAADILTFAFNDSNGFLGEILLSYDGLKIRAKASGKSILETAAYLIIHGACHIFGYTHKKKNDTLKMEAKEQKILKQL
ncbi:MAG: rRNA maturation RNase YbeY [bacterium]